MLSRSAAEFCNQFSLSTWHFQLWPEAPFSFPAAGADQEGTRVAKGSDTFPPRRGTWTRLGNGTAEDDTGDVTSQSFLL